MASQAVTASTSSPDSSAASALSLSPVATIATPQPHQEAAISQAAGVTNLNAGVRGRRCTPHAFKVASGGTNMMLAPSASAMSPANPGNAVGFVLRG